MGEFYGGEPPSRGDAMMCEQLHTLFGSFRLVKSARTWKDASTWQQWMSMGDLDIDLNGGLIGKYRIIQKLGEGATSEVYLCRDDFHDRHVAIKRVRSSALSDAVDGPVYARFFAAEAALVGRLQHPNVVHIYDAVPDPTSPYVVMEYVPGTTLRAFCRPDHLLPLELIVEIGFKCAMALGYVYRQGLIHRDVKPANILALVNDAGACDRRQDHRLWQRAEHDGRVHPDPPGGLAGLHGARAAGRRGARLPRRHLWPGRRAVSPHRRAPALRGILAGGADEPDLQPDADPCCRACARG
jgi:hypothetical protein